MRKNLFICWLQGFNNAPLVVKRSLNSWVIQNPKWKIHTITYKNINNYIDIEKDIPNIYNKQITKPHLADIIRVHLLHKYGGVWCDATTICNKPLDEWLHEYIKSNFFAFKWNLGDIKKQTKNRILSNWFLYSNKQGYTITEWKKKIDTYWNNHNNATNYFIHHNLFGKLYKHNNKFKNNFNSTKDYSSLEPYFYKMDGGLMGPLKDNVKNHIDNNITPLYKITYKYKSKLNTKKSTLNYILQHSTKIEFIHVGKSGGTTVAKYFNYNKKHKKININDTLYTVIWIRNPISRIVSAFNFAKYIINYNYSNVKKNKIKQTIGNNIAFEIINKKINNNNKYAFSKTFDTLIKSFNNANDFLESLSSPNQEKRKNSLRLIDYSNGINGSNYVGFFKNMSYYLDNGNIIDKDNKQKLFVGLCENTTKYINKLSKIVKVKKNDIKKLRENKHYTKKLSPVAIRNIKDIFKNTEYKTLQVLLNHNLINVKTFNQYNKYN